MPLPIEKEALESQKQDVIVVEGKHQIHHQVEHPVEPSKKKEKKPRRWPKRLAKTLLFLIVFCGVALWFFASQGALKTSDQSGGVFSWLNNLGAVGQLAKLAISSDRPIKGENRDRINVLLLGVGGKGHDGGYLTDTIMLISLKPSTKQVSMISIPRDLYVPIEDNGWRKINAIGALAEKENPGSGAQAASQAIGELFKVPIDYYARVDFEGFAKVIDELGGVDVTVDNTLDDYSYPVLGMEDAKNYYSRYEHLHFDPGLQHMDGSLALKFARSRHGVGKEGSDFARAKRQQKIIEAVKDKLFSASTFLNPALIGRLFNTYQEHVSTNFEAWEVIKFWTLFKEVPRGQIVNKVLDNSADGLLMDKTGEDGAYLLVPRSGDFSQIQYMIENIFANAPAETKAMVIKDQATVEVRNGTWVNGLASKVSTDIEQYGFDVINIKNAAQRNYQTSVIYDLTNQAKIESLALLKEKTNANIGLELPNWLTAELNKQGASGTVKVQPDFILILGESASANQVAPTNPN